MRRYAPESGPHRRVTLLQDSLRRYIRPRRPWHGEPLHNLRARNFSCHDLKWRFTSYRPRQIRGYDGNTDLPGNFANRFPPVIRAAVHQTFRRIKCKQEAPGESKPHGRCRRVEIELTQGVIVT